MDMIKAKQLMPSRSVVAMLMVLGSSGCVTQQYIVGDDNQITERVIDSENAAMARLKLAIEYLRKNQISAAKQNLDRAATINDEIDGIQSSYAFYYQKVGEVDKADTAYRKALRQFPENANIRNNYGVFLCDRKRYAQAQQQFIKAINTDANSQMANSHENAGLCAIRAKNWGTAKNHLSSVLKYEPYRARALLGLAKANLELNDISNARVQLASYSKVYTLTPESLWVNIQIENRAQNYPEVETLGRLLLTKYPKSNATRQYMAKEFR